MPQYATYSEFITSYGRDFAPGSDSIFPTSGDVNTFLEHISSLIDLYAGQTFSTGVVTETFTASSEKRTIFTKRFPLNSVTSIEYYPYGTTTATSVDADTYMYFDSGKIIMNETLVPGATYKLIYNAGYTTVPVAIKQATLMLAQSYASALDNNAVGVPEGGNTTRFVFDKYEENYVDPRQRYDLPDVGIPVTVMAILNKYKFMK